MERVFVALIALALTVAVGCRSEGEGGEDTSPPPVQMPEDDPARGIYNYEHAKAVGIDVSPLP